MKQNLVPKVLAAMLLGILFGWYIHHDYVTWSLRGRDAFIAHQMRRFDMYFASPRPIAHSLVVTALFALGVCVLYEMLVAGLSSILNRQASSSSG